MLECPRCGKPMDSGEVQIKGRLLTFLFYGLSRQYLWWYPHGDRSQGRRILRPWDPIAGQRCPSCGTVMFSGEAT